MKRKERHPRIAEFELHLRVLKKSESTVRSYVSALGIIQQHVVDLTLPAAQVEPKLRAWRTAQYRLDVSVEKILMYRKALTAFYEWLGTKGYVGNPAEHIEGATRPDMEPKPLTPEQTDKLFSIVDPAQPEATMHLALLWLWYHGLRRVEAAGLTTEQVRFSRKAHGFAVRFRGKGGKTRVVTLSPDGSYALARHLLKELTPDPDVGEAEDPKAAAVQLAERVLEQGFRAADRRVFTIEGRPLLPRQANRIFERYRTAAGLPEWVTPHKLRHTFATELLENDEELITVKELLGHTSIRQTEGYTKVLEGKRARATRKLRTPQMRKA